VRRRAKEVCKPARTACHVMQNSASGSVIQTRQSRRYACSGEVYRYVRQKSGHAVRCYVNAKPRSLSNRTMMNGYYGVEKRSCSHATSRWRRSARVGARGGARSKSRCCSKRRRGTSGSRNG